MHRLLRLLQQHVRQRSRRRAGSWAGHPGTTRQLPSSTDHLAAPCLSFVLQGYGVDVLDRDESRPSDGARKSGAWAGECEDRWVGYFEPGCTGWLLLHLLHQRVPVSHSARKSGS